VPEKFTPLILRKALSGDERTQQITFNTRRFEPTSRWNAQIKFLRWYSLFVGTICTASVALANGLPYVAPTYDQVLNSSKKTFVHYVNSPLQYNQSDYWPNSQCMAYIIPSSWPASAGNQRLCSAPPITSGSASTYIIDNLKAEIVRMIARGINGIALDLFSVCDWSQSGTNCPNNPGGSGNPGALINVLNAAAAVDSRFKILPMPDMTAGITPTNLPNLWTAPIGATTIYNHPNIYHWPDANNYPELSPYCTECFSASQYSAALSTMKANGTPVSWAPIFGSLGCNGSPNGCVFSPYASLPTVSIGGFGGVNTDPAIASLELSNIGGPSGGPTYGGGTPINWTGTPNIFGSMSPQAYQTRSGWVYEAQNSLAYRVSWESQIALGSSLGNMMIVTWNDFGESTAMQNSQNQSNEPSTGFYDLTGYYTTWWGNGAAPTITNDAIMYFYRRQTYLAAHNATISGLTTPPTLVSGETPSDNIEMVAFLTSPATLSITISGVTATQAGTTGLNVFTIPLVNGTPVFSIVRNGTTTLTVTGFPTYGSGQIPASQNAPGLTMCSSCFPAAIPDPVYYSGSTFDYMPGTNLWGSDLVNFAVADPSLCEQSCLANSACKSWSYGGSHCWLKQGVPLPSLNSSITSGVIPPAPF
jgi:hypothetical protein